MTWYEWWHISTILSHALSSPPPVASCIISYIQKEYTKWNDTTYIYFIYIKLYIPWYNNLSHTCIRYHLYKYKLLTHIKWQFFTHITLLSDMCTFVPLSKLSQITRVEECSKYIHTSGHPNSCNTIVTLTADNMFYKVQIVYYIQLISLETFFRKLM